MQIKDQLLFGTAALALSAAASAQTVRDAVRLNPDGFNPNGPNAQDGIALAQRGSDVYACWTDQFGTTTVTQDIFFARSTDDGLTFEPAVRVDLGDAPNATDSDFAKIAVADNGNIVIAWEEKRDVLAAGGAGEDVFYNLSTDGGSTWLAAALPINADTAGSNIDGDIDRIWLSVSGDTFHCTWEEDGIGGLFEEVRYARSLDAGLTWSMPITLSNNAGNEDVDDPKVEASGETVIVAYIDGNDDVIVARSTDEGATFAAPVIIESDPSGNADEPQLEVFGDTVLIGFNEFDSTTAGGEGVRCIVSQDGGATWLPEVLLSVKAEVVAGADTDTPQVFIESADNMYVVYDEDSDAVLAGLPTSSQGNNVYIAFTKDGGQTWSVDVPVSMGTVMNRPEIVVTGGAVVVATELDGNGENTLAFFVSTDGGASFGAANLVPSSGPDADFMNRDECVYMVASEETNTVTVAYLDNTTGANEMYRAGLELDLSVGQAYCTVITNSTGIGARLLANGSTGTASNSLYLRALDMPQDTFGLFLASSTSDFVAMPGGSAGNLCIGPAIGRGVGGKILNSGASGSFGIAADLSAIPTPMGPVALTPGDRVYFQTWFRDGVNGMTTSNYSNGLLLIAE